MPRTRPGCDLAVAAGEEPAHMNEHAEHQGPDAEGGADHRGSEPKSRPIYDKSTSEATRELRDTARRRRDAEEKLQQHLREAREHVPHDHHGEVPGEVPPADRDPEADEDYGAGKARPDMALEG
jgi:hypothetical protein